MLLIIDNKFISNTLSNMAAERPNNHKVAVNMWVRVRFQDGIIRNLKVMHDPQLTPGVISAQSPVGSALIGSNINEQKTYTVKGKTSKFTVIDIIG